MRNGVGAEDDDEEEGVRASFQTSVEFAVASSFNCEQIDFHVLH